MRQASPPLAAIGPITTSANVLVEANAASIIRAMRSVKDLRFIGLLLEMVDDGRMVEPEPHSGLWAAALSALIVLNLQRVDVGAGD